LYQTIVATPYELLLLAQEFRDYQQVAFASQGFTVKIIEASDRVAELKPM
jgi:hypothetical protein